MSMELRDLRWAIVAAQHRSLRQAAEALHIRQSTLSRRLRDLEYQMGAILFERTRGGTWPTMAGEEFLGVARRVIDEVETVTTLLKIRSPSAAGQLTVGIYAALSAGNLRATLVEHWNRFPNVEINMIEGSSDHLISDLASSTIDVVFAPQNNPRWNDRSLPVWSERIVVCLSDDHPLTRQAFVRWADLKHERLLLPQRGLGPDFLKLLVNELGCTDPCDLVRHDVGLDRLMTLVGVRRGILLALEGMTGVFYPGVIFREVHDVNGATRLNFGAYWRQHNRNPSLRLFLDMLRERYPDFSSIPPPT